MLAEYRGGLKSMIYDVKFNEKRGAASLIIHSDSDDMSNRHMYVANLNGQTGAARLFKFEQSRGANGVYNNAALDLANSKVISLNDKNEYLGLINILLYL